MKKSGTVTGKMRKKWTEQINIISRAIETESLIYNEFESKFLDTIYDQVINKKSEITWKQSQALTRICNKIE